MALATTVWGTSTAIRDCLWRIVVDLALMVASPPGIGNLNEDRLERFERFRGVVMPGSFPCFKYQVLYPQHLSLS